MGTEEHEGYVYAMDKHWPGDPLEDRPSEDYSMWISPHSEPGDFHITGPGFGTEHYTTAGEAIARLLHLRLEGFVPFNKDLAWLRRRIREGC